MKRDEKATYLNAEVSSVHVVSEEEVPRVAGRPPHFKQLHKIKELSVDITTYCEKDRQAAVDRSRNNTKKSNSYFKLSEYKICCSVFIV